MKAPACVVALVAGAALSASAIATPLNLSPTKPDVASAFIDVSYVAGGGANNFAAAGFAVTLTMPDMSQSNFVGTFNLTATIDSMGNASGGTLTVTDGMTTLFSSSNLLQFGFGSMDLFEFVFESDGGGSLAPAGARIGTIMVVGGLMSPGGIPDFSQSFATQMGFGNGNADTFLMVPTPAAAMATLAGLGMVARRRRR